MPVGRKPLIPASQLEYFKREYQAGFMSNVQIAEVVGRSEAWVRRWAKILGLKKSDAHLPVKLNTKKQAELLNSGKADEARTNCEESRSHTQKEIQEHKALVTTEILRAHRTSLAQIRTMTDQLVEELAIMSTYPEEMSRICEIVAHAQFPDDGQEHEVTERIRMYEKMFTLHARTPVLNSLVNSLTKLIESERKTFGLDKEAGGDGGGNQGLGGNSPENLLAAVLANKEELTVNLQINNYGGSDNGQDQRED